MKNLGKSGSHIFTVGNINILWNSISFHLKSGINGNKFFGGLIIQVNKIKYYFGTEETSTYVQEYYGDFTLFKFPFPSMPIIDISLKAGGTVSVGSKINKEDPEFVVEISGSIDAKVEINAGWDKVCSISAGVRGNIISAEVNGNINKDRSFSYDGNIGGGAITAYIEGKTLDQIPFSYEYEIWGGWGN